MFDMAHVAGLIAGGVHPSPVPTPTSSPSRRTRRCAARVAARSSAARSTPRRSTAAVFPGLQGGPLEHVIAAKAVAFREAAHAGVRQLRARTSSRTPRRSAPRSSDEGFRLVTGGTDNHLLLVDLRDFDAELTGKVAQEALDLAGITLNRNQIPDDPRTPFVTSGLRLGSAAETTAGMGADEMREIASLIARVAARPRRRRCVRRRCATRSTALCAGVRAVPRWHDARLMDDVGWYVARRRRGGAVTTAAHDACRARSIAAGSATSRARRPLGAPAHHAVRRRRRDVRRASASRSAVGAFIPAASRPLRLDERAARRRARVRGDLHRRRCVDDMREHVRPGEGRRARCSPRASCTSPA